MAGDEEGLHQVLTADASQVTPAYQEVIDLAARLFAGLESTSAAGKAMGSAVAAGGTEGAEGIQRIIPPAEKATLSLKQISEAASQVSGHLGAVGVEAGAAAEGLETLTGALETLESTMGPLLLIAGVIAAIGAAFSFLKEGVASAADFQAEMTSLGVAVSQQGGNWDKLKDGVEEWIEIQERATGFTAEQLLPSLNNLVTAGASLADAQYMVAVAEDVARAKHIDLTDVVGKLQQAEAGRAQGLVKLDAHLKPLIADHANLSVVVAKLASDFSGQAAAGADTFEGSVDRLHAAWDSFQREIGAWLLPWLTDVVNGMIGLGDEVATVAHDISAMFGSIGKAIGEFIGAQDLFHQHDVAGGMKMLAQAGKDATSAMTDAGKAFGQTMDLLFEDPSNRGRAITAQAQAQRQAMINQHGSALDFDPRTGTGNGPKAKTGATGTDTVTEYGAWAEVTDEVKTKQTALATALAATDGIEAKLKENVKTATTVEQQRAAETALSAQVIDDLQRKETILNATIDNENAAVKSLTAQHDAAVAVYDRLAAAHDALAEKKVKLGHLSTDEEVQLKNLENQISAQSTAITNLNTQIDANNSALDENRKTLAGVETQLQTTTQATQEAAAAMSRAWESFNQAENERIAESQATFELSNAKKVAVYEAMLARLNADDVDYEKKREDLTKKIDDAILGAEQDTYKARADAAKAFTDAVQSKELGFLDDLLAKHYTLRDELKAIWTDIKDAFIKDIEEMILKSSMFTSLNKWLFGSAGGGIGGTGGAGVGGVGGTGGLIGGIPGITSSAQQGAAQYGILGAFLGTSGAPQVISSITSGGGGGGGTLGSNGWGVDGWDTGTSATSYGGTGTSGLQALVGGGLEGAGLGSLGASLTGGNSTNASIGGAIGGIGGALLSMGGSALGPIGAIALPLIGGVIGSLFGPPAATMQNAPDRLDPNYSMNLADWMGGQTASAQYNPGAGGTALGTQMQQWADDLNGNISGLNAEQKQLYTTIMDWQNGSTNPSAIADVTNMHNGTWTLASGFQVSYADAMSIAQEFQTIVGGGASGAPIYSLGRTYPDFNLSTLTNTGASSNPGAGNPQQFGGNTVIIQSPTIVGPNGLQTIATAIGQVLQRAANGQIIGAPSGWRGIGPSVGQLNSVYA